MYHLNGTGLFSYEEVKKFPTLNIIANRNQRHFIVLCQT